MTSRLLVSIRVAAPPERAFDVFTGDIGRWWRPNAMFASTSKQPGVLAFEPGEGGRLIETLANGKVFEIGRVLSWQRPWFLAFGWRQASFADGQSTRVEVRFQPFDAQTRVTVEHFGWDTVPASHVARHGMADAMFLRRHGEWWQTLLSSYEAAL